MHAVRFRFGPAKNDALEFSTITYVLHRYNLSILIGLIVSPKFVRRPCRTFNHFLSYGNVLLAHPPLPRTSKCRNLPQIPARGYA